VNWKELMFELDEELLTGVITKEQYFRRIAEFAVEQHDEVFACTHYLGREKARALGLCASCPNRSWCEAPTKVEEKTVVMTREELEESFNDFVLVKLNENEYVMMRPDELQPGKYLVRLRIHEKPTIGWRHEEMPVVEPLQ